MDLLNSLCDFSRKNINAENLWYEFKFNEDRLPVRINFYNGSMYQKNVILKKELHRKWENGSEQDREDLIRWFIVNWGGIKRNSSEKIKLYSNSSPDKLISLG